MQIETELKILQVDPLAIAKKLESLGAKKYVHTVIHDRYYDTDDETLATEKKRLRVRTVGDETYITYKKKLKGRLAKSAFEFERKVSNDVDLHEIFEQRGYKPIREKKKVRVGYTIGTVVFDIDMYDDIPPLLEVEAVSEKIINFRVQQLDLHEYPIWSGGTKSLYEYYGKQVQYC